jgi:GxxExxY protein
MPIHRTLELESITDRDFAEIDDVVMSCAYATQNHFGRLFDERIYENDLAQRLRAHGFKVHTQVPIKVSHGSFEKTYYLDLIVNQMLYELKVVSALLREHDAQAIHYAMLQNLRLVKLLNFGEAEVRGKLLRNALTEPERHQPTMRKTGWRPLGPRCAELIEHHKELIRDWGTHLSSNLYTEALVHQLGGEAHCVQRLELTSGDLSLGTHPVQMHDADHGFVLTSFTRPQPGYRQHLEVLLQHAPSLKGIQWINLNHSRLEVTTVEPEFRQENGGRRIPQS